MNVSSCGVKPVSTVCPATLAGGGRYDGDERPRNVVANVELGGRDPEHLRGPAERLGERHGARRRILLEALSSTGSCFCVLSWLVFATMAAGVIISKILPM
jgi:hypothetical protein